ncbi:MAG: DNA polymerase III subunit chi [Alphaproteobacteria bacterium]|nr:DNA polymerase III subunit chi [Alphaproteobacteria bacterium]
MSRVDFYHLQKQSLEDVLPKLLSKAYSAEKRILLKIGTAERIEFLNSLLWTYDEESFLPHGSKKDGFAETQPIWLTADDDNPNNADFLFLVDGAEAEIDVAAKFERVFNIFDGNSEDALQQARRLWKSFKEAKFDIHYWQQSADGRWEEKK